MAFSKLFLNNFETSDNTEDRRLKPHYYNNDYNTTQQAVIKSLQEVGFQTLNIDNNYHEMLFENKKATVIILLREISLYEMRVDIKISTKYLLPLRRPIQLIENLYELFDRKLTLKYRGGEGSE